MGKVSKQVGVLKLVRAGGIVELYKHPIKAVDIMERYPRHCVTRPDVFKFPNIVVKPESVLKVGQVFYIVPYHTIYRLLKSQGNYYHHHHDSMISNKQTLDQMEEIDTSFFNRVIPVENVRSKKQSIRHVAYVDAMENKDTAACVIKDGDYDSDETSLDAAPSGCFPTRKKGETNKGTTGCLKPCLKKNKTVQTRAQQGPRVRFMVPAGGNDDHEKWDK